MAAEAAPTKRSEDVRAKDVPKQTICRWVRTETWPLFRLELLVFAAGLAAAIVGSLVRTHGAFVYAIDDPYIHLAMARDIAFHGTWGLVPGVFQAASSSPLWTVLLAGAMRVSPLPADWLPLVFNFAAGVLLLWVVATFVAAMPATRQTRRAIAAAAPILLGVIPMVMTGMEHTLHAAIALVLVVLLQRRGANGWGRADRSAWAALLAVGTFVRLETAFVAAGAVIGMWLLDRPRPGNAWRGLSDMALTVGATGLPIALVATVNRAAGGYALPNSVVAKSAAGSGRFVDFGHVAHNIGTNPPLVLLIAITASLGVATFRRHDREYGPPVMALTVTGLLLEALGTVGVFGRYEGFLYMADLVVIAQYVAHRMTPLPALLRVRPVVVLLLAVVLIPRIVLLGFTPIASSNVAAQQAEMARFLGRYYDSRGVAVNDIGEVSYRHRGDLVDFEGLGSIDVLRARNNHQFTPAFIDRQLVQHSVSVVAIFEKFYNGVLPADLVPVARWCLEGKVLVNGDPCVTWYGVGPDNASELRAHLQSFQPELRGDRVEIVG